MTNQYPTILGIPLYKLHYLEEIADEPLTNRELEAIFIDYELHEIQEIVGGLVWASCHPDYPFSTLAPGGVKFSDQEIYRYLVNLLRQIERHISNGLV